jgi:hypothetical protein
MRRDRSAQFEIESTDTAWAHTASRDLQQGLQRLGDEHGYTTKSVDCRTTLCRALLEWPTYADAQRSWKAVLHESYEPNCATEVYVPPPNTADGPYEATVIFDCTEAR